MFDFRREKWKFAIRFSKTTQRRLLQLLPNVKLSKKKDNKSSRSCKKEEEKKLTYLQLTRYVLLQKSLPFSLSILFSIPYSFFNVYIIILQYSSTAKILISFLGIKAYIMYMIKIESTIFPFDITISCWLLLLYSSLAETREIYISIHYFDVRHHAKTSKRALKYYGRNRKRANIYKYRPCAVAPKIRFINLVFLNLKQ